ncbi:MAG: type IV pilus twitching motility protein PilT [Candidatus Saganbacteria bacterium]|nr:type IV pilus twitching motility protein PilT [Candidatus Saganbacteria bacterium]
MELNEILTKAVKMNASDIVITVNAPITLRIYTEEVPFEGEKPLSEKEVEELLLPIINKSQKEVLEKERDLDFAYVIPNLCRFRVNLHYEKTFLAAAFRPIHFKIPTREELDLPKVIEEMALLPRGMVLLTGPTGSGKSTTQACMIDIINKKLRKHIITIEDPIEYSHKNIQSIIEQREVGEDTPTFDSALKHVLRQNPDVILIGEMRDLETIQTAITAAETGHLVISTLHTNNSVQAIDRMIDVFPGNQQSQIRTQLSLSLQGILAQQLLPKQDGSGSIAAVEILKVNPAVRNLIRKQQLHEVQSVMELGQKEGMQLMDQALKTLVQKGVISREDALSHAQNPEYLENQLRLI